MMSIGSLKKFLTILLVTATQAAFSLNTWAFSAASESNISVTKAVSSQSDQNTIEVTVGGSSIEFKDYRKSGYKALAVEQHLKSSLIKINYKKNEKSHYYELFSFKFQPNKRLFNDSMQIDETADALLTSSVPIQTNLLQNSSTNASTPSNQSTGRCSENLFHSPDFTNAIKQKAIEGYVSSNCSMQNAAIVSEALCSLLDAHSIPLICLHREIPGLDVQFVNYWESRFNDAKEPFISCSAEEKSSFNNGDIILAKDVNWKDTKSLRKILLHEMLHSRIMNDAKVQYVADKCANASEQISDSGGMGELIVPGDRSKISRAVQTQPIPKPPISDTPTTVAYYPMDAESLPEVHQFIANNSGSAYFISTLASGAASRIGSELSAIPEARAAMEGGETASSFSGTVISYDEQHNPVVSLSNGKTMTFSQPFPDIPVSAVEVATHPGVATSRETASAIAQLKSANRAAGLTHASGSPVLSVNGGTGGPGVAGDSAQRAPASYSDFKRTIRSPADVRVAIWQQSNPHDLLNQPAFGRRLADPDLLIQVRDRKQKWGSEAPKTKWNLDELMKMRPAK